MVQSLSDVKVIIPLKSQIFPFWYRNRIQQYLNSYDVTL